MFAFGQSQPQQSPFGAAPAHAAATSPFSPAFGQQTQAAPAFGGAAGGMFGASQPAFGAAPAFGATAAAPAFGAFGAPKPVAAGFGGFGGASPFGASAAAPAFGAAGAFGQPAQSGGFGAASAPAFGAAGAAPAFGAAAAPAFGAAPTAGAFGAPFTSAFGAPASPPAFGASATTAFGAQAAPASPFGGSLFGTAAPAASSPFGTTTPGAIGGLFGGGNLGSFGQQQVAAPAPPGTRGVPYSKTVEKDGTGTTGNAAGGASGNFISITAMPNYAGKSVEELRYEDYAQGVKSMAAGPPSPAQAVSPFGGAPAAAPSLFGQSAPAFGFGAAAPAAPSPFGASASAFGAPAAAVSSFGAPGGGLFGAAASSPAFGGAFGAPASAPAFGQSAPATGFGASPAPAFGAPAATSSLFGAPAASGAFGTPAPAASGGSLFGFGASPAPAFGAAPAAPSPFGATQPSPFGAPSASSLFGAATSAPAPSPFGAPAAASPFGAPGGVFGAKPATSSPFGSMFGGSAAAPAATGAFSFPSFTSAAPGTSSLFPSLGAGAPFGAPATAQPSAFNFPGGQPAGAGMFGNVAATPGAQPGVAPPNVTQSPYGSFPQLPTVSEPKVGISARPAAKAVTSGNTYKSASPLLSLRSTSAAPRFGAQVRSSGMPSPMLGGGGSGGISNGVPGTPTMAPTPTRMGEASAPSAGLSSGSGALLLLPARPHPHRLFIREPPPSTESASSTMLTPARAAGGVSRMADDMMAAGASPPRNNGYTNGHDTRRDIASPRMAQPSRPTFQDGSEDFLPRLGRLLAEGYSFEPSPQQLEAMYRLDPSSIKHVMNFTVSRHNVGQIRWLRPVDVEGLLLDRIITIQDGEVFLYSDCPKPPVGEGLNLDAEVTLCNVYKTDTTSGLPIREGPRLMKWERALRNMCGQMGAKFVAYKPDGGVWKFEVEHFSRYGLLNIVDDDDSEDDSDLAAGLTTPMHGTREPATQQQQRQQQEIVAGDIELSDDEERRLDLTGSEQWTLVGSRPTRDGGELHTPAADGIGARTGHWEGTGGRSREPPSASPMLPAPPLQHTLATQLNLNPLDMMAMRHSFFPAATSSTPALGIRHAVAAPGPPAASAALQLGLSGLSTSTQQPQQQHQQQPLNHCWKRALSPLVSTPGGGARSNSLLLRQGPTSPLMGSPSAPTPGLIATGRQAPSLSDAAASAYFVDAGLSMGRSFRIGWGPGGQLASPANAMGSGPYPCTVHVQRVKVEGPAEVYVEEEEAGWRVQALRTRLRSALRVHLEHSKAGAPSVLTNNSPMMTEDGMRSDSYDVCPRRSLFVERKALHAVTKQYIEAAESVAARLCTSAAGSRDMVEDGEGDSGEEEAVRGDGSGATQAQLKHEVEAWHLLQLLFEYIEGEQFEGSSASASHGGADADAEGGAGASTPLGRSSSMATSVSDLQLPQTALAGFKRRAALSSWLRRQARPLVEAELTAVASTSEAVLRLLSGHQLAGAVAVASASGDVRLATMLATAGTRSNLQEEASQQLRVWKSVGHEESVDPERLLIYYLLAGQVAEVQERLDLDWRRYLGLLLWYCCPPTASPSEAVSMYREAYFTTGLSARPPPGSAPRPLPSYLDAAATQGGSSSRSGALFSTSGANDLHYELLQLWADREAATADGGGDGGIRSLSTLLQAAAYSPNPMDASLAWHVMTTLEAIGPLAPPSVEAFADDCLTVHLNYITQIQLAGGLCEWAVYVALHVADQPAWPGLRDHLVSELLVQHCAEWSSSQAKQDFLTQELGLSEEMLASACATWALYCRDAPAQCVFLLSAKRWNEAHRVLVASVAPMLFIAGQWQELASLLTQLVPNCSQVVQWDLGGGLYAQFLDLFYAEQTEGAAQQAEDFRQLSLRLHAASEAWSSQPLLYSSSDYVWGGIGTEGGGRRGGGGMSRAQLRQKLVLSRMSQKLQHELLYGLGAQAAAPLQLGGERAELLKSLLGQGCLSPSNRLAGVAAVGAELIPSLLV